MTSESAEDSLTGLPSALLPPLPPPPPPPSSGSPRPIAFQIPVFENVEDVDMYGPGGYHPVNLGDVVGHRFKIIHKLGNGGFALVWLARDLDQERYVALKILKADARDGEVKVLEHLKNAARNDRITNLYETFTIRGPNGFHRCLVLELGGPSLGHLSVYCKRPSFSFLKAAARELVEGLAALHAAGVCHGDLSHSNVLFEIKGLQNWTEDEIYSYLGPPKTAPLLLLDGTPAPPFAPAHIVDSLDYSHFNMEHLSSNILITDFGEAFFQSNVPKALGTPASFSAPELLFGYQPSWAVDLWALGCLIYEFHTFRVLIPTVFASNQEALAMAAETVGSLPETWQEFYYDHSKDFLGTANPGEKHRWFDDQIQRTRTLDSQVLAELPELSPEQRATFLRLLKNILVFEPSCRLPIAEILKHPWFNTDLRFG